MVMMKIMIMIMIMKIIVSIELTKRVVIKVRFY